ncbi:hypothetical protein Acr_00g0045610 [Actinidia rufa]|uniref:Retrotransposon gag domain-containing protein n=1 Tax=Actinidia rufa TaxID=165716 RepID=A0A7J0DJ81_9ERIC|nr:hypothetical protein Acr_00g0045610 [Actinidia rufa]
MEGQGGANPQVPQDPEKAPKRCMREFLTPTQSAFQSCIILPIQARAFVVKPNMIQLLLTFYGMENESAHLYVKEFEELVATFLEPGQSEEIARLKLFPFYLKEKAKAWFNSLKSQSLSTWADLQAEFFKKFFPMHKTIALRKAIQIFLAKDNEPFGKSWEHDKDILRSVPTSWLRELANYPDEALDCFEQLADRYQSWDLSNSIDRPREAIVTSVESSSGDTNEEERVVGLSNTPCPIPAPFPQRLRAPKRPNNHAKIYKLFEQVKINIPLLNAIKQIPAYAKFLKVLCTVKCNLNVYDKAFLMEQASSIIQTKIVPKYKDPKCPTILIVIRDTKIEHALLDLGASVNLLPYSVYKKLGLAELKPTSVTFQLTNRSIRLPRGGVKDVLVQVEKFYFLMDFVVLDMQPVANLENQIPIILGRPFLSTSNAFIQCRNEIVRLAFGNMTLELNIFNVAKQVGEKGEIHEVSCIDSIVQGHMTTSLLSDPLESCLSVPPSLEYSLSPEVEYLYSLLDVADLCEVNGWAPRFEELPPIEEKILPSNVQTPKLELKPFPFTLKYAFLGKDETFPVVISSSLEESQETKLLELLRVHQNTIGWTIADIKGISPLICTHHIYLEDDVRPSRQPQRRLNPHMKDVVRNEVLKLLDVGIIYSITDSKLESLHRLSKTQLIYKKEPFSTPLHRSNLREGCRSLILLFPRWDSGYNQIEIALEDQEKTTFTCPFGTFAYRRMPFELCNASGIFQRCMMGIFSDLMEKVVVVFMDDFSIFGDCFESCL